jgi:hypothetical protein
MNLRNNAGIYFFQNKGYLPVDDMIVPEVSKIIVDEYLQLAKEDSENKLNDPQCPINSKSWYGQPKCEYLMLEYLPSIEKLIGLKLLPTYTYMRVYGSAEVLHMHTDRPSCEISITINLGQSSDYDWPIWYADPNDLTIKMPISVMPGSGMIYRGCDVPHWREEFSPPKTDDWQVQLFLHYVNAFGPYPNLVYDGKDKLFIQPIGDGEEYKKTDIKYNIVDE